MSICLLLFNATACSDDDNKNETPEIPKSIKDDFEQRQSSSEIINFYGYKSDGIFRIQFNDSDKNIGDMYYIDYQWKITTKNLNEISKLPEAVQNSLRKSKYADANILDILETKRDGIEKILYRIYFKYSIGDIKDVEHYMFLNEDGTILTLLNYKTIDDWMTPTLPKFHFDFIKTNYPEAEIRGYLTNNGRYEYFIIHNNVIKFVFFDENKNKTIGQHFWKETQYELPVDTKIPENVRKLLNKIDANFKYTNLYYIESKEGNAYLFMDKSQPLAHGYTIGEDVP